MSKPDNFFKVPTPESLTKIEIVSEYFDAWSNVLAPKSSRIAYVDLFAGPGSYEDGTESVPLRVLKVAAKKKIQRKFTAIFNDSEFSHQLECNIKTIPGINTFAPIPKIYNLEVRDFSICAIYDSVCNCPTLFYIDPWGYKGLSLDLVGSTIKGFGSDCIFFFNYARINRGLENQIFTESMDALFGKNRSEKLRQSLDGLSAVNREAKIVNEMISALNSAGATYVHNFLFCFPDRPGTTSHYLFHLTKHPLGNRIIKRITAKKSTAVVQGIAKFRFDRNENPQGILFDSPVDELQESLLNVFAGNYLSVAAIIATHPLRSSLTCTDSNYKTALIELERAGKITCDRPAHTRPRGTLADSVIVYFPKRRKG